MAETAITTWSYWDGANEVSIIQMEYLKPDGSTVLFETPDTSYLS